MGRLIRWALLASLLMPGWAQAAISVRDDQGSMVRLPQPAQRVVSLLPSLTESVCVLRACERLVAVDRWSDWPASVQRLPRLGSLDGVNVEAVVALRPDLVLVSPASRLAARLRGLGLTVAEFEANTFEDVPRVLRAVAVLLGREAQATLVWQGVQARLQQVQRQVPPAARGLRVYVEVGPGPYAASQSSYVGSLLSLLGADNVVPRELGPFPKLNPEFVVRAQPDLIMVGASDRGALGQRPGWSRMAALQEGRVCAVPGPAFTVLMRPGPRLGEAAQTLAHCLAQAGGRG